MFSFCRVRKASGDVWSQSAISGPTLDSPGKPSANVHKHTLTRTRTRTHTRTHRATAFGRQKQRPPNLGRVPSPLEIEYDRPPCAALLAAPLKAGGKGFAPRGQPLQRCTVHVAGALDLNDAAPSSSIPLPARTAAPRQTPRKAPTTRYSPARNRPSPQHAASSAHSRLSQAPAHSAAARRCTQRTSEVQRCQLRHL